MDDRSQPLKERTEKSLFWSMLNNGTLQLLNILFGVVLARLLTPGDYGIVGVLTIFTLIAVIISILGTIGMSLFFIRQRQKEISIRKVMGSTSAEVLLLMLRIFSIPLLIAFVVAVPLSWYVMTDWLSNFSYRIALSAWIFVAAGFTCFIISLLTVVFQSWRAASENPVNNIKTE